VSAPIVKYDDDDRRISIEIDRRQIEIEIDHGLILLSESEAEMMAREVIYLVNKAHGIRTIYRDKPGRQ